LLISSVNKHNSNVYVTLYVINLSVTADCDKCFIRTSWQFLNIVLEIFIYFIFYLDYLRFGILSNVTDKWQIDQWNARFSQKSCSKACLKGFIVHYLF